MNEAQELRLGICSCCNSFNGQFEGRRIETQGKIFHIREMEINEKKELEDLRNFRTHLFLDAHPKPYGFWTKLQVIQLRPNGNPRYRESLLIADPRGFGFGRYSTWGDKWWYGDLPAAKAVVGAMPKLLGVVSKEVFERWLCRMDPPGWTLTVEKPALAVVKVA